jgi:APA family basic amino acid/polyamine antiporter
VQNLLAGLKVAALVVLVAAGFALGRGSTDHFTAGGAIGASGWLIALIPIMFSYAGWNAAAYVAEEVRDPQRNVPWALGLGTFAVVALYLGINLLYVFAFTPREMSEAGIRLGDLAAEQLMGARAGQVMAALSSVIMLGSISAMVLAGPRVYFAMARDGLFFAAAARVHPTYRTPWIAIAAQGAWSTLLVLSGTFDQLLTYTGIAVVLFAGVAVTTVFVLRRKVTAESRPFSAWGYPWAPALFAVASAAIVVNAIVTRPATSLAGLAVMAAGLPLYAIMRAGVVPDAPKAGSPGAPTA